MQVYTLESNTTITSQIHVVLACEVNTDMICVMQELGLYIYDDGAEVAMIVSTTAQMRHTCSAL